LAIQHAATASPTIANTYTLEQNHTRHGIDILDNDGSSSATRKDEISLAAGAVEFLDPDHAGGFLDDTGRFQFFYYGAAAAYGWSALVRYTPSLLLPQKYKSNS
jgi:hypothetical protein